MIHENQKKLTLFLMKFCFPLTAFYAHGNLQSPDGDVYCGYSLSNTVYRFCIAAISIFLGVLMCIPGLPQGMGKGFYWLLLFIGAGWFCATTADCTAVAMSYGVCRNFFGGPNAAFYGIKGTFTCENDVYGKFATLCLLFHSFIILFA